MHQLADFCFQSDCKGKQRGLLSLSHNIGFNHLFFTLYKKLKPLKIKRKFEAQVCHISM